MRLGPHEITREIGRGGMGVVLLCRDPEGRDVAIKVLKKLSGDALLRFERERKMLEGLGEADGFVPLLDAGESPQGPYLVMPFVPGGTLRARIEKGPLPVADAVAIARALASALAAAHARGIVHRDLKPENVVFTADGRPLILDLGLAKHWSDGPGGASLSKTGEVRGSVGYMAPEQASDSKSVGPSADVFALGAILYELVTGAPAFKGDTAIEVLARVQSGHVEPVRQLRPEAPAWVARTIEACLARDPVARPADGRALVALLETGGPRRTLSLAAISLLLLGLGAGVLVLARREEPERVPRAPLPKTLDAASPRTHEPLPPPRFEARRLRLDGTWGSLAGAHAASALSARFSPDGELVASGGLDGRVSVWRAPDLAEVAFHREHGGAVERAVFLPDSDRVLSSSDDGALRLFSVEKRRVLLVLEGHGRPVGGLALSSDGKLALSGDAEGKVALWDLERGTRLRWLEGHKKEVSQVAFLPGGASALSASDDGTLGIWTVATGEGRFVRDDAPLASVAASPDGRRVLVGTIGGWLRLLDVEKLRGAARARDALVYESRESEADVVSVEFSPDGRRALSACVDGTLRLHDLERLRLASERSLGDAVGQASFSPDGRRIVIASGTGALRVFDGDLGRELVRAPGATHGKIAAIVVAGDRVFTAGLDRRVHVWDRVRGAELSLLEGARSPILTLAASADGARVATGGGRPGVPGAPGELLLWDVARGTSAVIEGQKGPVRSVALAPDGRLLFAASWERNDRGAQASLWRLDGAPEPEPFTDKLPAVNSAAFSGDGLRVVLGTTKGLHLWDLEHRTEGIANPGRKMIHSVATAGNFIVEGDYDAEILVWNPQDPIRAPRLKGHAAPAVSLSISPDRRRAVSASLDRTVRLWAIDDAPGEIDRVDLGASGDAPCAVAFEPDGRSFLVATARGVVLRFAVLGK